MRTRLTLITSLLSFLFVAMLVSPLALADTYYVDGNVVGGANDGSSWANAKSGIAGGYGLAGDGEANLILVRGDFQYTDFTGLGYKGGASDTERLIYRGVPGTNMGLLPILDGSVAIPESSYTKAPGSNVYWFATAQIRCCWEGALGGEWGFDWDNYPKAATLAACNTTPGTYFWSNETVDKLYIHTSDSSSPTNFIIKPSAQRYSLVYRAYITLEGFIGRHNQYNPFLPYSGAAPYPSKPHHINWIGNIFHHINSSGGLRLMGANGSDNRVCSNTVFSCNTQGIVDQSVVAAGGGTNNYFCGNTVYSNLYAGIVLASGSHNSVIRDNVCYDNGNSSIQHGISLAGADNCAVYNNVCFGNAGDGIAFASGSTNESVYNNTTYDNSYDGISFAGSCNATKVFNNNIWVTGAAAYGLDVPTTTGFTSDYNNIHTSGGAQVGNWGGAAQSALSNWKSASSQDANSISADPKFVDTSASPPDLRLLAVSPCINAGTASFTGTAAPAFDIDGIARPQGTGYDIGAYELIPSGTVFMIR